MKSFVSRRYYKHYYKTLGTYLPYMTFQIEKTSFNQYKMVNNDLMYSNCTQNFQIKVEFNESFAIIVI